MNKMERVNVKVIPAAATALTAEQIASGMSATDVTNRALQVYHYLMEEIRAGKTLRLRDGDTGRYSTVVIEEREQSEVD